MELQATYRENKLSELIETTQNENGEIIVSGRDLHNFLGIKTKYQDWIKRMFEYGFEENVDYAVILKNEHDETAFGGIRKITEHAIKIDMAKEIAMIQRSEKGKQARQYFLQLEKLWNSPEKVMERALEFAKQQVKKAEERIFGLETKVEKLTHSGKTYTADELGKELGVSSIKLNKELYAKGFQYKRNGTWLPYAKYADKGYVEIKQSEHNGKIVYHRKFTELGRQFIIDLFEGSMK